MYLADAHANAAAGFGDQAAASADAAIVHSAVADDYAHAGDHGGSAATSDTTADAGAEATTA